MWEVRPAWLRWTEAGVYINAVVLATDDLYLHMYLSTRRATLSATQRR